VQNRAKPCKEGSEKDLQSVQNRAKTVQGSIRTRFFWLALQFMMFMFIIPVQLWHGGLDICGPTLKKVKFFKEAKNR
jgi:hypothetical protein